MKQRVLCSPDQTFTWKDEEKLHALHICADYDCESPRKDNNITIMACFHRRHNLGDDIVEKDPEEFWGNLVKDVVPDDDIVNASENKKFSFSITEKKAENSSVPVYDIVDKQTGEIISEDVSKENIFDEISDELSVRDCMILLQPYAEWLPLWLYDHSGISISCGERKGQFCDQWDSGQVGWIVALKKTIMSETVELIRDENGELIRIEHKHEGYPSTYSYLTRPLTDETWRERALEIMRNDVEYYNLYLTGETYGYVAYEANIPENGETPDWEEVDSCWGFIGDDILENGIADNVGSRFMDVLKKGDFKIGEISYVKTPVFNWE